MSLPRSRIPTFPNWPSRSLLDPKIITKERELYVDVDLNRSPNYGDTLTWTPDDKPERALPIVHVQEDLDTSRFYKLLLQLMKAEQKGATTRPITKYK